jgi:hypothetical protein
MMFFFDIKSLYSSSTFSNIAITFLLTLFSRLQAGNSEAALCYVRHMLCAHETQVTSIKQDYDQAESELNVGRSRLKECDSQINRMAKEQQKLQQKLSDSNVGRTKMENEVVHDLFDVKPIQLCPKSNFFKFDPSVYKKNTINICNIKLVSLTNKMS